MKARPILILLAVAALALPAGWLRSRTSEAPPAAEQQTSAQAPSPTQSSRPRTASPVIIRAVTVRDVDGRVAWRGDVDLAPVLSRIEAGVRDPHRNDGGVFGNRERRLPEQRRGYYREYVIRTPGITHAGPQRLIVGAGGELYYTPDHYSTFQRVRR